MLLVDQCDQYQVPWGLNCIWPHLMCVSRSHSLRGDHGDVQAVIQTGRLHGGRICPLAVQLHRRAGLPLPRGRSYRANEETLKMSMLSVLLLMGGWNPDSHDRKYIFFVMFTSSLLKLHLHKGQTGWRRQCLQHIPHPPFCLASTKCSKNQSLTTFHSLRCLKEWNVAKDWFC